MQIAAAEQTHYSQPMTNTPIELGKFVAPSSVAMGDELCPPVITAIHDRWHADTQFAAVILLKFCDETTQSDIDGDRARLVNKTSALAIEHCDCEPTAVTVASAEAK